MKWCFALEHQLLSYSFSSLILFGGGGGGVVRSVIMVDELITLAHHHVVQDDFAEMKYTSHSCANKISFAAEI